jgi:hypothetical protein
VENIAENRGVEHFNSDVSIEQSGDNTGDEGNCVSKSLEAISTIWDTCEVKLAR